MRGRILHHAQGEQTDCVQALAGHDCCELAPMCWVQNQAPVTNTGRFRVDGRVRAKAAQRIDNLLGDPKGLPNGKGNRTKLKQRDAQAFKLALVDSVGHAFVWASHGPLPNRVRGTPDNAVCIFIDDIVRACEAASLKPGSLLAFHLPEIFTMGTSKSI